MLSRSSFAAGCALLLALSPSIAAERVLFIGNSFTFGAGSAVRFYRSDTVTDLNDEGVGGVPALFKSFADQAGLDYDVALETRGGTGLDFHLAQKRELIVRRGWDVVVAHGYSTLDADAPRDPSKLVATSRELAEALRSKSPDVDLYLMATWSRADQVYPAAGAWTGRPIETMATDIRMAYDTAATGARAKVIPVGDAWNRAMRAGVADPNPYDGLDAGKLDLWTYDHYHASTYGYYLEALVIFGRLTGRDPRSLGPLECSAFELGLSRAQAQMLQQVAFDELATIGVVAHNAPPPPPESNPQRCDAG
jgi:hypothetical protein